MRSSTKTVLLVAGVGILVASAGLLVLLWAGSGQDGTEEPVVLRTYHVPPDYQDDLRGMLDTALRLGDTRLGRVTHGPGGTLLVVAPPRLQNGVQQILDAGFEVPPVARPVTLTYWLLVGRAVEASQSAEPFSVIGTRRVSELEPVLRQIATAQGPTEFALLEEIQLTSMSQVHAEASGRVVRVEQTVVRTGEQVVTDVYIELQLTGNTFQSRVMLEAGQFLVVGQAGLGRNQRIGGGNRVNPFPDVTSEELLTLYYVMAADLEP